MSFPLHAHIKQENKTKTTGRGRFPGPVVFHRPTANQQPGPCTYSVEQRSCWGNRPIPGISADWEGKPAFQENANGFPNICIKKGGKKKAQSVGILLLYPRRNNANEIALENVFMILLKVSRNARNKTGGKAKQGQLTNLGRTHEQKWRDRALALCQWKHLFI